MPQPRLVAFLRAINVGGRNVKMEVLRRHFEELGLKEVETFIASGNVIFRAPARGAAALEAKIERHLAQELGYEVSTFLRTEAEVAAIARHEAFSPARVKSARAHCVGFLAEPLDAAGRKALASLTTAADEFSAHGREVYWLCRTMQSESKFNNALFERKVGVKATFRGLSTIGKLAAKLEGRVS